MHAHIAPLSFFIPSKVCVFIFMSLCCKIHKFCAQTILFVHKILTRKVGNNSGLPTNIILQIYWQHAFNF